MEIKTFSDQGLKVLAYGQVVSEEVGHQTLFLELQRGRYDLRHVQNDDSVTGEVKAKFAMQVVQALRAQSVLFGIECYNVKAANVIITRKRSGIDIAVPIDYGSVIVAGQPRSSHSHGMATLAYALPEVLLSTHKQPIVQGTGAYQASMLLLETALEQHPFDWAYNAAGSYMSNEVEFNGFINAFANEQMPRISHLRDFFALEDCSEDVARFLGYLILTDNEDQKVIGYIDDTFNIQLPRLVQNGSFQRA